MLNSHHVNFQIAMLGGTDVAVLRTFEVKIQLLPPNIYLTFIMIYMRSSDLP